MIGHEETLDLIKKAQNGDENAKVKLIEGHSPLVKSLIKRYMNKGIEYEDLYQLGCLGFAKAINKFDFNYNTHFSTYAVPIILGEVKRHLRDEGYIKVSRNLKLLANQIRKYIDSEQNIKQTPPSLEDIAKKFNIELPEVIFCLDSIKMPLSIHDKGDNDNNNLEILDRITDGENTEKRVEFILLKDLICDLSKRDKKIIYMRYFKEYTQSEIARILGISQVQVSRIETKILANLKEQLN